MFNVYRLPFTDYRLAIKGLGLKGRPDGSFRLRFRFRLLWSQQPMANGQQPAALLLSFQFISTLSHKGIYL